VCCNGCDRDKVCDGSRARYASNACDRFMKRVVLAWELKHFFKHVFDGF